MNVKDIKVVTVHHLFSITGTAIGCFGGYALPGLCNQVVIIEFSSIFLNFRLLHTKEEMKRGLPYVNQIAFSLSYTALRVC